MNPENGPAPELSRSRLLAWTGITVVAATLAYHAVIHPARRSIADKRARVAANARLLAALPALEKDASGRGALGGKSLPRLSTAGIVQSLTELAQWTDIRRVTFTTREVTPLPGGARRGKLRPSRLPVTVMLEAPADAFAIYLDALGALPYPVQVKSFEMQRARQAPDAMQIRLAIEIYGLAA